MGNNYVGDELLDADGDPQFANSQVNTLRERVKSPGK